MLNPTATIVPSNPRLGLQALIMPILTEVTMSQFGMGIPHQLDAAQAAAWVFGFKSSIQSVASDILLYDWVSGCVVSCFTR